MQRRTLITRIGLWTAATACLTAVATPAVAQSAHLRSSWEPTKGPDTRPVAALHAHLAVEYVGSTPSRPGGLSVLQVLVSNRGPGRIAPAFALAISMPRGAKAQQPTFPANCAIDAGGTLVVCRFPAGLGQLAHTATALVPFRVLTKSGPTRRLEGGSATVIPFGDPSEQDHMVGFSVMTS